MKVTKGAEGGNNLKVDFVTSRRITAVKIADEGEMREYTNTDKDGKEVKSNKLVLKISYDGMGAGDPDTWITNNKSRNALIDAWSDDTAIWVGKIADIQISGDGEYRHITVDTLRTK